MKSAFLASLNLRYAFEDLMRYCSDLNTTQWGILSACAVAFGFLCMRSNDVRKH